MLPSIGYLGSSWSGAEAWKDRMRNYPRTMGHIILCREEETGRVYTDKNGKRQISYVTGTKEREWIRNGFEGITKLLHAQGALEICTSAAGLPVWRRAPGKHVDWSDDQSFLDFLEAYRKTTFDTDRITLGSAHQMGTCRMSGSARTGVVDLTGKVWGKEGLYVADASVFPSASGVNPMITTMTFGEWIGRRLAESLRRDAGLGVGPVGEAAVEAKL
jgi:choline dehydrogenase-like flavoprotein